MFRYGQLFELEGYCILEKKLSRMSYMYTAKGLC